LAAHNFDVEDFPSAEEFLASSVSKAASCLVVDIGLRGMSGIELKRQMIRHGVTTPIIFITALDDQTTIAEAKQVGCVTVLLKPFLAVDLVSALNRVLS
jgi:FixJ family two-component response regulator